MADEILLSGIDGSNPLGFLAAAGALRLLDSRRNDIGLRWAMDGAWRPVLTGVAVTPEQLCAAILECSPIPGELVSLIGKNLTVPVATYREFVLASEDHLVNSGRRAATDFAAAFASEACEDRKKARVEYTDLCFITGSGHQDFIETAKKLTTATTAVHIYEALFQPWRRSDKGLSFRWDPADAIEYALRWDDPGPLGASSVWGANRLAIEALPLFPVQPTASGLATTGFTKDDFTWPIWTDPVSCSTVRALLSLAEIQEPTPDRQLLAAMGIAEVFRSRRVRIGQGANFKVSFRPSRSA